MTAALGLYQRLGLPPPWRPAKESIPLLIYGGAGPVGGYAIKLAQASNIHPLIVVAGNSKDYVESLISREKVKLLLIIDKGMRSSWKEYRKRSLILGLQS